ncbi:MAG TPA: proton-conducting transporter membrane subunit [Anaerolineaceae bacterium]|nr:proton-conducting transporter membrane subunit [Anaerolineaceae bacterium]
MEMMVIPGIDWNNTFSSFFILLVALVGVYSWAVPQGGRRWWFFALLMAALVIAALQPVTELARMLLLDAAAFAAVALVGNQTPAATKAARTYLWLLVVAVLCITTGLYLSGVLSGEAAAQPGAAQTKLIVGLLVVGFALKLALIPFYFWLPSVAQTTSPMTTALIVGVVDIAEFSELAGLRTAVTWAFEGYQTLWLTLALASMFGGALLALAQRDLKRMLAFSTIDDMGYLLLGVLVGTNLGLTGAMVGALSHALFKVLLFGALGVAEKGSGGPITLDSQGLASRYPISGAAFIVGALGMIGIPPLFGFVGRWRLYLSGIQYGGLPLILAMAVATGLALFYYVRAIHQVWFGEPQTSPVTAISEPKVASIVLGILIAVALLFGLFPGLLFGQV